MALLTASVLTALTLAACGSDPAPEETMNTATETLPSQSEQAMVGTIVDVASESGTFTTLVAAIGAADLANTLSSEGPFTVFAPTNEGSPG